MRTPWLEGMLFVSSMRIVVRAEEQTHDVALAKLLIPLGYERTEHGYSSAIERKWGDTWQWLRPLLESVSFASSLRLALLHAEYEYSKEEMTGYWMSIDEADIFAEHCWLPDAVEQGLLVPHFQPVIEGSGEVFGYEALVRAMFDDGMIVNGGKIFAASRALGIEHLMDRHLHELAIRAFAEQGLNGFLFINLVPGFIQRAEFYFNTLTEAVRKYGLNAKRIILDCSNSEKSKDLHHLKSICNFCRSQGYLIALDNVNLAEIAVHLLREMHPDFIKLDMSLVQQCHRPEARRELEKLVAVVGNTSCSLLAEGIETEESYDMLQMIGITLFQGYFFSPPVISPKEYRFEKKSNSGSH